jgi:hypothetical protein
LDEFDEDDLYAALDWLASQQERIERELYQAYVKATGPATGIGALRRHLELLSKGNATSLGNTVTTATASGASSKSSSVY